MERPIQLNFNRNHLRLIVNALKLKVSITKLLPVKTLNMEKDIVELDSLIRELEPIYKFLKK